LLLGLSLVLGSDSKAQDTASPEPETHAGIVPVLSGGIAYIQNEDSGVVSLEPQVNPVLLVAFGRHVLLESRTDFFGFFQREHQTTGPYKGKVFKSIEFAQLDWLANTHAILSGGRYILPFGSYAGRMVVWNKNLQDAPITAVIGTRTSGAGDGLMLRGTVVQNRAYAIQYTTYFSAYTTIHKLEAARTTGGDSSIFINRLRLEAGVSYQRFLQGRHINSVATYLSWQPRQIPLDIKAEGDYSYYGRGYWIESAYLFQQLPIPSIFRRTQVVARMQQFFPLNGGGNSLPTIDTQRFDFGLNYYFRDDARFVSSYGRRFSSQGNANVWNFGFTYRFMFPLWPARNK
jgi:hypothetical protein